MKKGYKKGVGLSRTRWTRNVPRMSDKK